MNVSYNTLHRGSQPLDLGDQYWSMRDAIVQAELLIMRMLKFQVTPVHPHKVSQILLLTNNVNVHVCQHINNYIILYCSTCFIIYDLCKVGLAKRNGPSIPSPKRAWHCCKIFIIPQLFLIIHRI